ncbi:hypothetical protein Ahy_B03g063812 [Arachis hypogaea]|uniref:Aminotransferase-like plant mobile domain-containing protein n=1 Tax=Arachis hypogaea TaxID=3818 RepID=A0A444ZY71_ARAHY|nr:hypothetical protein Ahy_B03g063812 [Arachis hypogaea]
MLLLIPMLVQRVGGCNNTNYIALWFSMVHKGIKNLLSHKFDLPEMWHPAVDEALQTIEFYQILRILEIRGHSALLAALVESWRLKTHTFILLISGVTVRVEDVAHIYGLSIDGEVLTGYTDSSYDFLINQSLAIFGNKPTVSSSSKRYIKLS